NFCKGVDCGHSAEIFDALACMYQNGIIRFVSRELKPEIGFDAGAYVRRSAVIDGPAAVFILMANDLPCGLLQARFITRPQQCVQQDVVGFEGGIGFELAAPVASGLLSREEDPAGAIDCGRYAARYVI